MKSFLIFSLRTVGLGVACFAMLLLFSAPLFSFADPSQDVSYAASFSALMLFFVGMGMYMGGDSIKEDMERKAYFANLRAR